jgi:hypothetical protein
MILCNDGYEQRLVSYDNLVSGRSTRSKRFPRTGVDNYDKIRGRWEQIYARCHNPLCPSFKSYGGRGIILSEEFHDPRVFAQYVSSLDGYGSRKHLDRIDNDRGYVRGNLRWVTAAENNRNRRGLLYVDFKGERMVFMDFVRKHTHLSYGWAREAFHRGISLEVLARLPPGKKSIRRVEREKNITFPSIDNAGS